MRAGTTACTVPDVVLHITTRSAAVAPDATLAADDVDDRSDRAVALCQRSSPQAAEATVPVERFQTAAAFRPSGEIATCGNDAAEVATVVGLDQLTPFHTDVWTSVVTGTLDGPQIATAESPFPETATRGQPNSVPGVDRS